MLQQRGNELVKGKLGLSALPCGMCGSARAHQLTWPCRHLPKLWGKKIPKRCFVHTLVSVVINQDTTLLRR